PLLVFTASFMIAGGMEIIVSRPLGTRGIYVVGIATLLALSEHLFPKYFTELPGLVRSLSSSPLAVGLSAAIVLSLLFRFGTRQIAAFVWSANRTTISAAFGAVEQQSETWRDP